MVHSIACITLATAMLAAPDEPRSAAPAPARTEAEEAVRSEYNARKERASRTAASQIALAQWCHQRGLTAEAQAHAVAAIQLGARTDAPWKLLGFTKVNGRWLAPEQIEEDARQREANRQWAPKLTAWHRALHGSPRQRGRLATEQHAREAAEAEQALAAIDDPRAVAAIYHEFAQGTPADQRIAVQLLGQIQGPAAGQALAALAIYGADPAIRRVAVETLRVRDVGDYVDTLINLLATPLRYEVHVGPENRSEAALGRAGNLLIEGEDARLRRSYVGVNPNLLGQSPDLTIRPGDFIMYDADGFPVIHSRTGGLRSPRQALQQYANAARSIQAQLQRDIAWIEAENAARREFNSIVFGVLKNATGQDLADDRTAWKNWLADTLGRPREQPTAKAKPLYFQNVKPYDLVMPGNEQFAYLNRAYEGVPFT